MRHTIKGLSEFYFSLHEMISNNQEDYIIKNYVRNFSNEYFNNDPYILDLMEYMVYFLILSNKNNNDIQYSVYSSVLWDRICNIFRKENVERPKFYIMIDVDNRSYLKICK